MSTVDVIILDIDGGAMLDECLASVRAQTRQPDGIIVFDNGSRRPLQIEGVKVIRSERNIGFAAGVNEAYRAAASDYIALINNDVVLDRDWLQVVANVLDNHDVVGAVQTIIRRDEDTIDGAGIDISDGTFRQIGYGKRRGSRVTSAWGVSATAVLLRRIAVGDRVFDPRFFAYYEDVELNARLHEKGFRTPIVHETLALHRGSASAGVLGEDAVRLRTRNRYLVARLHPGVGRVSALLREDLRLLLKGRSSFRGIIEGLWSRL